MTASLESETMMSLIMADGKIVPITSDGSIIETEVFETNVSACIDNPLLQTETSINYDKFLEKVICVKCKICKHLAESREEMILHLKSSHEEEIDGVNISSIEESKNEELSPENDITGLSFVLSDPEQINSDQNNSKNFRTVIVQPQSQSQNNSGEISNFPNCEAAKGGFLCGGCSRLFGSEQEIAEHLSLSETCSVALVDNKLKEVPQKTVYRKSSTTCSKLKTISESKQQGTSVRLKLEADHEFRTLKCAVKSCGFMFKKLENLRYHQRCHNSETSDFQCLECPEKFEKWRECATHLWKSHSIDCDLFLCGICKGFRTMYPRNLEAHCQIHSNLKSFQCDVCSKRFNQLSQLKNHIVTHLDKTIAEIPGWAKPKQCDICSKHFSDAKALKKHVKEIHSKLKPYICNICNHKSARKAMLQLHMRQHTGDKPFHCDICDYKTGDHNCLRRHKRRHTGFKPYKCPHCSYAATQSSTFRSHLKSKHSDKPEVDLKKCHVTFPEEISSTTQNQPTSDSVATSDMMIFVDVDKSSASTPSTPTTVKYEHVVINTNSLEDITEPLHL